MSGIFGIFHPNGKPVDGERLAGMALCLSHRGVDGSFTRVLESVGIGCQVRHTTRDSMDVELPLESRDESILLTADVRIDNREELTEALGLQAPLPVSTSDEELLINAYERWGEDCLEKILGDFAFALWDNRSQRIFCARDSMGVKPFYYYHRDGDLFLFASEIKALLSHPETPRRLNETRVADYLAMNSEDKAITFYQDIHRLPPGCSITVTKKGITSRKYWSLDPSKELYLKSDEEYAEAFRDIFTEAVRCRLRRSRRIGFLLSGGLDSSSMVCAARGLMNPKQGEDLISFSASFPDLPRLDEQPYIDAVLGLGGFESILIRADKISPLQDINQVYKYEDEPFHMPNLFIFWALAKAAKERGVSILMDGIDGDTTVSHGLEFLIELIRKGRWITFAREVGWLSKRFKAPQWRFFWHYGVQPAVIEPIFAVMRTCIGRAGPAFRSFTPTLNSEFARRIGWDDRFRSMFSDSFNPVRTHKELHWRQLTSGIIPFTLEVNDRAAAAFGLEPRHPYFDRRLVEFCYAIPPEQRLCKGWDRVVQRRAMEGLIPEKIQWRIQKSAWGPNFKRGLMSGDRERIESILIRKPHILEKYVDIPALRKAFNRCQDGQINLNDGMNVWLSVTLGLWLELTGLSL